jgi:uncharacterized PurR-regulated membrane protein YhhQ (DUF165 family)
MDKPKASLKYFDFIAMMILACQLLAYIFGARVISLFSITLPGGIIPFCITFFLWNILTELYAI